jgi:hypothetical protein
VAAVVEAWGIRFDLTEAERDILLRSALGDRRDAIAAARGVSVLTLKTQIATMLRKSEEDYLQTAVATLLREVAGV